MTCVAVVDPDAQRRQAICLVLESGGGYDVLPLSRLPEDDALWGQAQAFLIHCSQLSGDPACWKTTQRPLIAYGEGPLVAPAAVPYINLTAHPLPALAEFIRQHLSTL